MSDRTRGVWPTNFERLRETKDLSARRTRRDMGGAELKHFHFYSEQDRVARCGFFLEEKAALGAVAL